MEQNRIKAIRKAARITQEELAEKLSVNRATVSKYENGDISLSLEMLRKIARRHERSGGLCGKAHRNSAISASAGNRRRQKIKPHASMEREGGIYSYAVYAKKGQQIGSNLL